MKNLNNDEKYVSYENVIYRLAGYEVYEHKDASYPNFKTLKTEERLSGSLRLTAS